jgi:hypothetical protein
MTGHVPGIAGHGAENTGHVPPKYAIRVFIAEDHRITLWA